MTYETEIMLYTRSNCRDTEKVKAFLNSKEIPYYEYDINYNTTYRDMNRFLRRYNGYNHKLFPHMVIHDKPEFGTCLSGTKTIMETVGETLQRSE